MAERRRLALSSPPIPTSRWSAGGVEAQKVELVEYVLVSQDAVKVEVFRRPERGHWVRDEAGAGESIVIHGRSIAVDEIYRRAATSVAGA